MLRRLTVILLPASLAVLTGGALWLTYKGFVPVEIATDIAEELPRYEMHGAQWLRYGEDGNVELRAQADDIRYFDDRSMELDRVRLDRLGNDGPWVLEAERGHVPARQTRMQLLPEAQIDGRRGGQPVQVRAPEVWVDWSDKTITSRRPVQMRSPGRSLDAIGFEADWQGRHLRFLRQVEMRYVAP